MKPGKREITLNEYDSLLDMLSAERALLGAYCAAICAAERKEGRTGLVGAFSSAAEDVFFLRDLLDSKRNEKAGG